MPTDIEKPVVNAGILLAGFKTIGVIKGDVLFFHSSLKSFGWVEGGADTIIDSAIEAVSPDGTVVVPTFVQRVNGQQASYSQRQAVWDIDRSVSDVGRITETLRLRSDSYRSNDSCNALSAIGREAKEIMLEHHRAGPRPSPWGDYSFGHGSPWDWLVERNAVYLLMGVGFNACSLLHYVQILWMEEKYGLKLEGRTFPKFDFSQLGERIRQAGLITETVVGSSRWQAFRTAPVVEYALQTLNNEPGSFQEIRFRLWRED